MNLDQDQRRFAGLIHLRMHRLDQRAFAHAACAPQKRVVGGQAVGEAPGIGDQSLALIIGDYVVTLGIAVPGLTLYLLRLYTDRSIRRGNPKSFTRTYKLGLVSISWVVLVIAVALLLV